MKNTMLNTERTFGIEIECVLPWNLRNDELETKFRTAGIDFKVENYNHSTRTYWKAVTDASIQTNGRGIEFVSPILKGVDGLAQVEKVCEVLNACGATVNKTCGLHVHHGAGDFKAIHFDNIKRIYSSCEPELDKMMPLSRRESNNEYCRTTINNTRWDVERYCKLNLTAFVRHGTLEFRQHSGTTDATKIIAWVHLTQAIMERAKGRKFTTTVKNREYFFDGIRLWNYLHTDPAVLALVTGLRKYVATRQKELAS